MTPTCHGHVIWAFLAVPTTTITPAEHAVTWMIPSKFNSILLLICVKLIHIVLSRTNINVIILFIKFHQTCAKLSIIVTQFTVNNLGLFKFLVHIGKKFILIEAFICFSPLQNLFSLLLTFYIIVKR